MADDGQQTAEAKLAAIESTMIRDALRKEAATHGILDESDMDNIPLTGVAIQNGTITGVKELVQNIKASKGHWFASSPAALRQERATQAVQADYLKSQAAYKAQQKK